MLAICLVSEHSIVLLNRRDKKTQQTKNPLNSTILKGNTQVLTFRTSVRDLSSIRINLHFGFYSYTEVCALLTIYYLCMYGESTLYSDRLFILVLLTIWLYSLCSSGALIGCTSISCRSWKASDAQIYGNIIMKKIHSPQTTSIPSSGLKIKLL